MAADDAMIVDGEGPTRIRAPGPNGEQAPEPDTTEAVDGIAPVARS